MSAFLEFKKLSNPEELILRLVMSRPVGYPLAKAAFADILNETDEVSRRHYMAMVLNGMLTHRSTPQEVAGLLDAIFEFDRFDPQEVAKIDTANKVSVTLAGSGKKGFKTVNISSVTAFVVACTGVTVAKMCAPSTSSKTGSQDFIEMLGADLAIDHIKMQEIMETQGIGFFSVMSTLPQFSRVYTGNFYSPHALVFAIAPLAAPFKTDRLVFGLAHPDTQLALNLMQMYGRPHAFTVGSTYDGIHFIDEVSSMGGVHIDGYKELDNKYHQQKTVYFNELTGVDQRDAIKAIAQCEDSEENIVKGLSALTRPNSILAKEIALNASVVLRVCHEELPIEEAYQRCLGVIKSGKPLELIEEFVRTTGGDIGRVKGYIARAQVYVE